MYARIYVFKSKLVSLVYIVSSCFVLLSLHAYYGLPVCCVSFLFFVLVVVFSIILLLGDCSVQIYKSFVKVWFLSDFWSCNLDWPILDKFVLVLESYVYARPDSSEGT